MCQNKELLQDVVLCMILTFRKKTRFRLENMESNVSYDYEMLFRLVSKVHT